MVVLASPLYYWFISGQLKTAFDRLFAVAECDPDYRNPRKESVLDGVRLPIERTAALNGWTMVGSVCVGGVMEIGDIDKTDGCAQAAALAEKF